MLANQKLISIFLLSLQINFLSGSAAFSSSKNSHEASERKKKATKHYFSTLFKASLLTATTIYGQHLLAQSDTQEHGLSVLPAKGIQGFNNQKLADKIDRKNFAESSPRASKNSKAYVFLLAGCDPDNPSYRGNLLGILVSAYSLKQKNLSLDTDIIVLAQLASHTPDHQVTLPESDSEKLQALGIQIRYLPKPTRQLSFHDIVVQKLHVLSMTEYSKIIFLDADILPYCNLDYLFKLSESGRLQANVLHSMYTDPVNAGVFLVSPEQGDFEAVQEILEQVSPTGVIPPPEFNRKIGWGQAIEYASWDTTTNQTIRGDDWSFYCGNSDQGLLLYYLKLIKKQVSIIIGPNIEHYDGSTIPSVEENFLNSYSCLSEPTNQAYQEGFAGNQNHQAASLGFYQDFHHAVGYSKFWEQAPPKWINEASATRKSPEELSSSTEYWYFLLKQLAEQYSWDLDFDNLQENIGIPSDRGELFISK